MGTRPGRETAIVIPWRRGLLVWMGLMLAETLLGLLRELFLAPVLGDLPARQLAIPVSCLVIGLIAWLTSGWMGARTPAAQVSIGAMWVFLTLGFEGLLGRASGLGWDRLLADYDPARGGFMIFGLAFLLFAPFLAAKLRRREAGNEP
jgi:hypothetical protein